MLGPQPYPVPPSDPSLDPGANVALCAQCGSSDGLAGLVYRQGVPEPWCVDCVELLMMPVGGRA